MLQNYMNCRNKNKPCAYHHVGMVSAFFSCSRSYLNHASFANNSEINILSQKSHIQHFEVIDSTFLKSKFNRINHFNRYRQC